MGMYAVYTRIKKGDGTDKEIMIMNIESTSCEGAEHKILDIHNSITNALAFDMANPIYFVNYITQYDYEDFKKRYISTVKKRQESIDEVFDEIKEIQEDNNELTKQIDEIKNQIHNLENQIKYLQAQKDDNIRHMEERMTELKEFCDGVNMKMKRSEENIIGIA